MTPRLSPNGLAEAAEEYSGVHKLRVVQLHGFDGKACSCQLGDKCGSGGKHPRAKDWPQTATSDPEANARLWRQSPKSNVGVAAGVHDDGSLSVVLVDIDSDEGERILHEACGGTIPVTWMAKTGKGMRLLFTIPAGAKPKTTVIKDAEGKEAIRYQSNGAQGVLPPSRHPSGVYYEWIEGRSPNDVPIAAMPNWMVFATTPEPVHPVNPNWSDAGAASSTFLPGGDYNRRGSWEEVLENAGFTPAGRRGDVRHFTRPGKKFGTSVTVGHYKDKDGNPALYNFSGSIPGLPSEKCYDLFGFFTRMFHSNGSLPDFAAAADSLAARGYGTPKKDRPPPKPTPTPQPPDPSGRIYAKNSDFAKLNLEEKWLWPKWLQLGAVNLLAAEGGLGKTRLMADLCRRIVHGLPWPDKTPMDVKCGENVAMWVAGDRNFAELVALSKDFGFEEKMSYSGTPADPTSGVELSFQQEFIDLEAKVKAAKPIFLVIDTAGGSTKFNLSKQEEARSFFAPLSDLAVRLGVCVVVITHLNASKTILGKRAEERVRAVIRMTATNRDPATVRRLEIVKSNDLYPAPVGVVLGSNGNEYTDAPPSPEDLPGSVGGGLKANDDDPSRGPKTKVRECADWLESLLRHKPHRVYDLRKMSDAKGFTPSTFYAAKKVIGAEQYEVETKKWWRLEVENQTQVF